MSMTTAHARRWLAVVAIVPLLLALSLLPRPLTGPADAAAGRGVITALPPVITNHLVAVTSDNRLWIREPVLEEASWTPIDDANNATGVAYLYGFLWSTTADNRLWYRDVATASEAVWAPWGTTDQPIVALTATSTELWAVTAGGRLQVINPLTQSAWTDVGAAAPGTTAITALGTQLWATTTGSTLQYRPTVLKPASWQTAGHANGVVALADIGGRLWARTSDNKLWARSSSTSDVLWTHVGHAIDVTEMTAVP